MDEDTPTLSPHSERRGRAKGTKASAHKAWRTVLLAVLFHMYWPRRLTRNEIPGYLPALYGENPIPALYRDLHTLTGMPVEDLPSPGSPGLAEWCFGQQRRRLLALTYDRQTGTFGLEQSLFELDITEAQAQAFVALQEGFSPGVPFAQPVQELLERWAWLFSARSQALVVQKRKRRARPVVLPLSPVEDYSQHRETILSIDQALEQGNYLTFAYAPLSQEGNTPPLQHEQIEPYELEYRDGHWYFTGYVRDTGYFVDYRVDRIVPGSMHASREHFLPGNRQRRGVKIRYWISPMLARHGSLSTRLQEQHVTLLEHDQGAIVEGYTRSLWWARRLLLGYGEHVRALEPEQLVQSMQEITQAMYRRYEEET